jgi:Pyruvate/2-oxoacid:ferredoxin oxidoreductase delta subunit
MDAAATDGEAVRADFCDSCRIVCDDRCRHDAIVDGARETFIEQGPRL